MDKIHNIDISGVRVQAWSALAQHWEAGKRYRHDASRHLYPSLQFQLWLIQDGLVEVISPHEKWQVKSGEVFLLPVTMERDILTPVPTSWLSVRLWITVFNRFNLMQEVELPARWVPDEQERSRLESWMQQIVDDFELQEAHFRLGVEGLSHAILGLCWPHLSSVSLAAAAHTELPEWLAETLRRITSNPAFNVADLAHEAGFSLAQFRRSFHQYVGSSPRDYLKSRRLVAARHFLEHTDLPMRVIAERIGLQNAGHFSQVFKEAYGLSPSHYRASHHHEKRIS